MFGIFDAILCVLQNILLAVAWGGCFVANGLILAFGTLLEGLVLLLPTMPAAPEPPDSGVLSWLAWFYPLGGLTAAFMVWLSLWAVVNVSRIIMRWAKVL